MQPNQDSLGQNSHQQLPLGRKSYTSVIDQDIGHAACCTVEPRGAGIIRVFDFFFLRGESPPCKVFEICASQHADATVSCRKKIVDIACG